jgi:hypothetical protein
LKDQFRPDRKYKTARIATPTPLTTFSYYGGKSKVAGRYPAPKGRRIIEPFAGAAAYSWRHRQGRDVWVNDIDPITISIWRFLQSDDAIGWLQSLPLSIEHAQSIDSIAPDAPIGLIELIRAEMSRGTQGRKDKAARVTAFGAHYYRPRFAARMAVVATAVKGWWITSLDYSQIKDEEATWFIDPPYNNWAGARYRHSSVDYAHLSEWCLSRSGQVIVCEAQGATWLPFTPLSDLRSGRQTAARDGGEAVFIQSRSEAP